MIVSKSIYWYLVGLIVNWFICIGYKAVMLTTLSSITHHRDLTHTQSILHSAKMAGFKNIPLLCKFIPPRGGFHLGVA